MHIRALRRCCDHKQDICQRTVKCLIINSCRHHHGCQSRLLYCLHLSMRNRNAAADAGTAKCFSCKDSFLISGLVLQPSSGRHEIYQFVNCFFLCGYRYIQSNAFLLQQFCNSHHLLPLFFIQLREQFHNFFPASDSMRKGSRSSAGRAKL